MSAPEDAGPEAPRAVGRSPFLFFVGCALVVLVAAGLRFALVRTPDLPVLGRVPQFSLTDQRGRTFGSADVAGKVWIASFIYTRCPGPCPLVVRHVATLRDALGDSPDLVFVTFSVDPETDTPQVLARYADQHGIGRTGHWVLLTGDRREILELVRKGFLLSAGPARELLGSEATDRDIEAAVASEGPIIHSVRLALVDRGGHIRGYYASDDPAAMETLARDASHLLAAD